MNTLKLSADHLRKIAAATGLDGIANEILAVADELERAAPTVLQAMAIVTDALRADPDYAWSWHCNVAMSALDEGLDHYRANKAAARFMSLLAGVDTSKHPGFPDATDATLKESINDRSERQFMERMASNHEKLTEFSQTVESFTHDYQRLYSTYKSYRDILAGLIKERDSLREQIAKPAQEVADTVPSEGQQS